VRVTAAAAATAPAAASTEAEAEAIPESVSDAIASDAIPANRDAADTTRSDGDAHDPATAEAGRHLRRAGIRAITEGVRRLCSHAGEGPAGRAAAMPEEDLGAVSKPLSAIAVGLQRLDGVRQRSQRPEVSTVGRRVGLEPDPGRQRCAEGLCQERGQALQGPVRTSDAGN
jgi:hypothetical protein